MRTVITAALLVFVAISVIYLVVSETKVSPATDRPAAGATDTPSEAPIAESAQPAKVVAYYFHGTMRCPTCLKLERYAQEAIEEALAAEIAEGAVEWRSVNYDEPANAHFISEYQLSASAVVLAASGGVDDGKWKNLDRIWNLVGDEHAYKDYVVEAVREMLQEQS